MSHNLIPIFFLSNGMVYYLVLVPMLCLANYVASYFFPVNTMSNVFLIFAVFLVEIFCVLALLQVGVAAFLL